MSCILNIETSTAVCSAALSLDGKVIYNQFSFEGQSHAALIGVYVEGAISEAKKRGIRIDAVAVSSGPGSYTGLRIGVSIAKGLCFGSGIPLIAVPTLEIMTTAVLSQKKVDDCSMYCAMLDARRMEVYASIFDSSLHPILPTSDKIVDGDTFAPYLSKGKVCFFGNGATKCKTVINSANAIFLDDIHPLAENMVQLSEKAFAAGKFENVAYFEPFYLKEFHATIAKNKVLGK
jgi:tRNA threonylcarbamoyladenosine biosynthesis protein TsaB